MTIIQISVLWNKLKLIVITLKPTFFESRDANSHKLFEYQRNEFEGTYFHWKRKRKERINGLFPKYGLDKIVITKGAFILAVGFLHMWIQQNRNLGNTILSFYWTYSVQWKRKAWWFNSYLVSIFLSDIFVYSLVRVFVLYFCLPSLWIILCKKDILYNSL